MFTENSHKVLTQEDFELFLEQIESCEYFLLAQRKFLRLRKYLIFYNVD